MTMRMMHKNWDVPIWMDSKQEHVKERRRSNEISSDSHIIPSIPRYSFYDYDPDRLKIHSPEGKGRNSSTSDADRQRRPVHSYEEKRSGNSFTTPDGDRYKRTSHSEEERNTFSKSSAPCDTDRYRRQSMHSVEEGRDDTKRHSGLTSLPNPQTSLKSGHSASDSGDRSVMLSHGKTKKYNMRSSSNKTEEERVAFSPNNSGHSCDEIDFCISGNTQFRTRTTEEISTSEHPEVHGVSELGETVTKVYEKTIIKHIISEEVQLKKSAETDTSTQSKTGTKTDASNQKRLSSFQMRKTGKSAAISAEQLKDLLDKTDAITKNTSCIFGKNDGMKLSQGDLKPKPRRKYSKKGKKEDCGNSSLFQNKAESDVFNFKELARKTYEQGIEQTAGSQIPYNFPSNLAGSQAVVSRDKFSPTQSMQRIEDIVSNDATKFHEVIMRNKEQSKIEYDSLAYLQGYITHMGYTPEDILKMVPLAGREPQNVGQQYYLKALLLATQLPVLENNRSVDNLGPDLSIAWHIVFKKLKAFVDTCVSEYMYMKTSVPKQTYQLNMSMECGQVSNNNLPMNQMFNSVNTTDLSQGYINAPTHLFPVHEKNCNFEAFQVQQFNSMYGSAHFSQTLRKSFDLGSLYYNQQGNQTLSYNQGNNYQGIMSSSVSPNIHSPHSSHTQGVRNRMNIPQTQTHGIPDQMCGVQDQMLGTQHSVGKINKEVQLVGNTCQKVMQTDNRKYEYLQPDQNATSDYSLGYHGQDSPSAVQMATHHLSAFSVPHNKGFVAPVQNNLQRIWGESYQAQDNNALVKQEPRSSLMSHDNIYNNNNRMVTYAGHGKLNDFSKQEYNSSPATNNIPPESAQQKPINKTKYEQITTLKVNADKQDSCGYTNSRKNSLLKEAIETAPGGSSHETYLDNFLNNLVLTSEKSANIMDSLQMGNLGDSMLNIDDNIVISLVPTSISETTYLDMLSDTKDITNKDTFLMEASPKTVSQSSHGVEVNYSPSGSNTNSLAEIGDDSHLSRMPSFPDSQQNLPNYNNSESVSSIGSEASQVLIPASAITLAGGCAQEKMENIKVITSVPGSGNTSVESVVRVISSVMKPHGDDHGDLTYIPEVSNGEINKSERPSILSVTSILQCPQKNKDLACSSGSSKLVDIPRPVLDIIAPATGNNNLQKVNHKQCSVGTSIAENQKIAPQAPTSSTSKNVLKGECGNLSYSDKDKNLLELAVVHEKALPGEYVEYNIPLEKVDKEEKCDIGDVYNSELSSYVIKLMKLNRNKRINENRLNNKLKKEKGGSLGIEKKQNKNVAVTDKEVLTGKTQLGSPSLKESSGSNSNLDMSPITTDTQISADKMLTLSPTIYVSSEPLANTETSELPSCRWSMASPASARPEFLASPVYSSNSSANISPMQISSTSISSPLVSPITAYTEISTDGELSMSSKISVSSVPSRNTRASKLPSCQWSMASPILAGPKCLGSPVSSSNSPICSSIASPALPPIPADPQIPADRKLSTSPEICVSSELLTNTATSGLPSCQWSMACPLYASRKCLASPIYSSNMSVSTSPTLSKPISSSSASSVLSTSTGTNGPSSCRWSIGSLTFASPNSSETSLTLSRPISNSSECLASTSCLSVSTCLSTIGSSTPSLDSLNSTLTCLNLSICPIVPNSKTSQESTNILRPRSIMKYSTDTCQEKSNDAVIEKSVPNNDDVFDSEDSLLPFGHVMKVIDVCESDDDLLPYGHLLKVIEVEESLPYGYFSKTIEVCDSDEYLTSLSANDLQILYKSYVSCPENIPPQISIPSSTVIAESRANILHTHTPDNSSVPGYFPCGNSTYNTVISTVLPMGKCQVQDSCVDIVSCDSMQSLTSTILQIHGSSCTSTITNETSSMHAGKSVMNILHNECLKEKIPDKIQGNALIPNSVQSMTSAASLATHSVNTCKSGTSPMDPCKFLPSIHGHNSTYLRDHVPSSNINREVSNIHTSKPIMSILTNDHRKGNMSSVSTRFLMYSDKIQGVNTTVQSPHLLPLTTSISLKVQDLSEDDLQNVSYSSRSNLADKVVSSVKAPHGRVSSVIQHTSDTEGNQELQMASNSNKFNVPVSIISCIPSQGSDTTLNVIPTSIIPHLLSPVNSIECPSPITTITHTERPLIDLMRTPVICIVTSSDSKSPSIHQRPTNEFFECEVSPDVQYDYAKPSKYGGSEVRTSQSSGNEDKSSGNLSDCSRTRRSSRSSATKTQLKIIKCQDNDDFDFQSVETNDDTDSDYNPSEKSSGNDNPAKKNNQKLRCANSNSLISPVQAIKPPVSLVQSTGNVKASLINCPSTVLLLKPQNISFNTQQVSCSANLVLPLPIVSLAKTASNDTNLIVQSHTRALAIVPAPFKLKAENNINIHKIPETIQSFSSNKDTSVSSYTTGSGNAHLCKTEIGNIDEIVSSYKAAFGDKYAGSQVAVGEDGKTHIRILKYLDNSNTNLIPLDSIKNEFKSTNFDRRDKGEQQGYGIEKYKTSPLKVLLTDCNKSFQSNSCLSKKRNVNCGSPQSFLKSKRLKYTNEKGNNVKRKLKLEKSRLDCSKKKSKCSSKKVLRLQTKPCDEFADVPKCLDCKSGDVGEAYCRFNMFRKLDVTDPKHTLVAGFSSPNDAEDKDLVHWVYQNKTNLDLDLCKNILQDISAQFQQLVLQEMDARGWSKHEEVVWKRAVLRVREMCDICSTTVFNIHWTCPECGFGVCLDCYRSALDYDEGKKAESYDWPDCDPVGPHRTGELTVTQIIPKNILVDLLKDLLYIGKSIGLKFRTLDLLSYDGWTNSIVKQKRRPPIPELGGLELIPCDNSDGIFSNTEGDRPSDTPPEVKWLCDNRMLHIIQSDFSDETMKLFKHEFRNGMPILVSNVKKKLNEDLWTPKALSDEFGHEKNDIINCYDGSTISDYRISKFWEGFENVSARPVFSNQPVTLLKLKDWPPKENFSKKLPKRFVDIMQSLPAPSYTQRDGDLNLSARLPKFFAVPDLGPKMYNAYGSASYPRAGTTNLHLDVSDATNVIAYVGIPQDEEAGRIETEDTFKTVDNACCENTQRRIRTPGVKPGALWHIFPAHSARNIRRFLRRVADERGMVLSDKSDPIHDQSFYLDSDLLEKLREEENVVGFPICQCEGDAVYIPAGAPHQVLNLHSCIKVAEDFVAPEHVAHCFQLTNEFRYLSDHHSNHEDKLQIKNIIFHSVKDCLGVIKKHFNL